jgi:hypothetical protein
MRKWIFWMLDWCYFANLTVIYYVLFEPKNVALFRTSFLFSFGCLGLAIATFRNSLVFHKIDYVTSVGIHACPMALMWNLRHHLMPIEHGLPDDQRVYVSLDEVFDVKDPLYDLVIFPTQFYLTWAAIYASINFIFQAKKIREKEYDTMYVYYQSMNWSRKILNQFGKSFAPIIFMTLHFVYFFISHLLAILSLYYFWYCTIFMVTMMLMSVKNGSTFYMDYFSKKYEASLNQLEKLEGQLEEYETECEDEIQN